MISSSQLYTALQSANLYDLAHLERYMADVSRLFLDNDLLLNPDKTDVVLYGTRQRLRHQTN